MRKNNLKLKTWHVLGILVVVVIAAYYPVLQGGFNSVDDLKRVNALANGGDVDVWRMFFSRGGHYYFRPLTAITFYFDRDIWGFIASFMHVENMLLHLLNSVMVFFVTVAIARCCRVDDTVIGLVAALLFALNPVCSEAVCWISGRYDLMTCLFLLLALWFLIRRVAGGSVGNCVAAAVMLLLASLSKEVAVCTLPGMLWLYMVGEKGSRPAENLRRNWLAILLLCASVVTYFVMRSGGTLHDSGIRTAVNGVVSGGDYVLLDKIRVCFKVYGFYFKKLFLPWPLNFGITGFSDWYVGAGIVLAVLLVWLAWRRDILGGMGLTAFFVLSPAILIPFGKMAWTPVAERYLYCTAAIVAPALAVGMAKVVRHRRQSNGRRIVSGIVIVLSVFFFSTLHRAWIWQSNERLFRDTVAKNPDFAPAKAELATALRYTGKNDEAMAILEKMQPSKNVDGYLVDDMNLAAQLMRNGEFERARLILDNSEDKDKKGYYVHNRLQLLIRLNSLRLSTVASDMEKQALLEENVAWLQQQQSRRPRPFTLYRIGKTYLQMGRTREALDYFDKTLASAPHDAFYYAAAEKMAARLRHSLNKQ